jgi:hypothetical protein
MLFCVINRLEDKTSKIFEDESPRALGESQKSVDLLFKIYTIVYGGFDKIIHTMDKNAYKVKHFQTGL